MEIIIAHNNTRTVSSDILKKFTPDFDYEIPKPKYDKCLAIKITDKYATMKIKKIKQQISTNKNKKINSDMVYDIYSEDIEHGAFCKLCDKMIKKIEWNTIYLELDELQQNWVNTLFGKMFYIKNGDPKFTLKSTYGNFQIDLNESVDELLNLYGATGEQRDILHGNTDFNKVVDILEL